MVRHSGRQGVEGDRRDPWLLRQQLQRPAPLPCLFAGRERRVPGRGALRPAQQRQGTASLPLLLAGTHGGAQRGVVLEGQQQGVLPPGSKTASKASNPFKSH